MTDQERMEKMAREYIAPRRGHQDQYAEMLEQAFLAGYQAALAQREAAPVEEREREEASRVTCCAGPVCCELKIAQALANARAEGKKSGAMEKL